MISCKSKMKVNSFTNKIKYLIFILIAINAGSAFGHENNNDNETLGALGVWMPIYDCWYYGGNPDDDSVKPMDTFDPEKDIDFVLYNQAFPYGKKLPNLSTLERYLYASRLSFWPKELKNTTHGRAFTRKLENIKNYKYNIRTKLSILSEIGLDPTLPIKLLVHGFTDNGQGPMTQKIKDAYMSHARQKFNIIAVDWGKGSGDSYGSYPYIANYRVPVVGKYLQNFTNFLIDLGIELSKIHLIGHSLGAQICGYAGRYFDEHKNKKLSVIIGLDPALPAFKNTYEKYHLTANDANYVQVIHTASGCLGYDTEVGTADFYPNYNGIIHKMPGCGSDPGWHCSHARAYEYFAESINSMDGFVGWHCDSLEELKDKQCQDTWNNYAYFGGEPFDVSARGVYTLRTNKESPFAISLHP